jgi:hypothetical protein
MYSPRLLPLCLFVALLSGVMSAQTAATASVTINGTLQGPIYPCGNRTCPTYDSGQIAIVVHGFTATTNYSHASNQKSANQLAVSLSNLLNGANSPVTATVSKATISLVSKAKGATANYPLSTAVTHSASFTSASFTAKASGTSLTGGSGGPTPIGTLIKQLSNNTSLCSSSNDPGGNLPFCSAFFDGFSTNPNDLAAETLVPDAPAGHISPLSAKQLMYPGWTGRLICEYQPWFGLASHKSVGYNENLPSTVAAQNSFMITEGCDINLVDFYGSLSANQSFNLATANAVFTDLNGRSGFPLKFGIMEDKGALTATCPTSNQTEAATVTCLQNALRTDMDYINTHYASSGVYLTDNGNPLVFTFIPPTTWPILTSADWTTIWTAVKAHTDTYAAAFKYIFQFGSFTTNAYDNGRFGWVQPAAYDATKQFWWGSNTNASPVYLDNLYSAGIAHPSQLTVGVIYKGFDDNNASWSGNRVMAQQCGQVLLKTANEIAKYFGGSKPQIPYVQIATWNDYEEGTSVEEGIDNCYTVNASLTGSQLTWSLLASDTSYASPSTVHHFNVYYTDSVGNLYSAAANLPVTANALDLSSLIPPGTWNVYVEMVGQPLIINRMSSGLTFIH